MSSLTDPGHTAPRDPPAAYVRLLRIAERDPRRAARLAPALLAADNSPWARYTHGLVLLRSERVAAARALLDAIEAPLPDLRYTQLLARQINGEGTTLEPDWAALVAAELHAGRLREAARALNEQVANLNVIGRHHDAYTLAQDSDELILMHGTPVDHARYYHVRGVAAGGSGALEEALADLDRAETAYRALRRPVDVARVRFERSWMYQRREDAAAAHAALEAALATFQRFDLPLRIAFCRKDLALSACLRGDYSAALAHIAQARTTAIAYERRDLLAYCEHHLGLVAHYSGLWDLALAAYAQAEAIYATRGQERLRLICIRNRAMVLNEQDRCAESLALLDTITTSVVALADQFEIAETDSVRARTLHGLGRTAEALAVLEAAEQQFRSLGHPAAADECRLNAGWIALDAGAIAAAHINFQSIGASLRAQPWSRWRLDYGLGLVAAAQGDHSAALDHYYAAGAAVATMRRRLASEHASSALFAQAQRLYRDALHLAASNGDAVRVAAFAEQQRSLVVRRRLAEPFAATPDIQQRREQAREQLQAAAVGQATVVETALQHYIDALLQARHVAPPDDLPEQSFDLEQMRAQLNQAHGRAWTVLAPIAVAAELHLLLITPDSITLTTGPYDAALRGWLAQVRNQRLRSELFRDLAFARGATPRAWHALRSIAERVLPSALRNRLHPEHRLFIVPGGPFHALPWAALRVGEAWLAEQAIIQYLPDLMPAPAPPLDRTGPAMLIGCAEFAGRAADLPSALATLDIAAAHWAGPTQRFQAAEATRSAVLAAAREGRLRAAQLLHIASHAVADEVSGLLARVLLADDELWVDDITRLNLDGGLVVLAACAGAASEVLPGDELIGVGRAFLAAGALGVLASFWPIYDRTVLPMITGFYAELARHGDPALALATMQRRLIDDAALPEIMRTPYVWSCFGYTSLSVAPA